MSKVCEVCGKHPVAGRSISHSHRVTNRKFRPNIQRVYCVVDGQRKKMTVCTNGLQSGKVARSEAHWRRGRDAPTWELICMQGALRGVFFVRSPRICLLVVPHRQI